MEKEKDIQTKQSDCKHKNTVCLNEEGYIGIFCVDCGEKVIDEC